MASEQLTRYLKGIEPPPPLTKTASAYDWSIREYKITLLKKDLSPDLIYGHLSKKYNYFSEKMREHGLELNTDIPPFPETKEEIIEKEKQGFIPVYVGDEFKRIQGIDYIKAVYNHLEIIFDKQIARSDKWDEGIGDIKEKSIISYPETINKKGGWSYANIGPNYKGGYYSLKELTKKFPGENIQYMDLPTCLAAIEHTKTITGKNPNLSGLLLGSKYLNLALDNDGKVIVKQEASHIVPGISLKSDGGVRIKPTDERNLGTLLFQIPINPRKVASF